MTFSYIIATGLGTGLLPKAPGTWGSLLGAALAFLAYGAGGVHGLMVVFLMTTFGGWVATEQVLKAKNFEDPDPNYIVIDEIAGISLTLILIHVVRGYIFPDIFFISFLLFRIFDILKPFPISWVDHKLAKKPKTAALGVMLDDLLAAFPAALCTIAIDYLYFSIFGYKFF